MDNMDLEHKPELYAASIARPTAADKARERDPASRAANEEFFSAKAAHEDVFGTPFFRNGQWQ